MKLLITSVFKQGILDSRCDWLYEKAVNVDSDLLSIALDSIKLEELNNIRPFDIRSLKEIYKIGMDFAKKVEFVINNSDSDFNTVNTDKIIKLSGDV